MLMKIYLLSYRPPALDIQAELRQYRQKGRRRLLRQQRLLQARTMSWLESTGPEEFRDSEQLTRTIQEYVDMDTPESSGEIDNEEY